MQFLNPLYWMRSLGQLVALWLWSFPVRFLGPATPSIIAATALLVIAGLSLVREPDWRQRRLRETLQRAAARGDHAEAELLARRLLRWHPDDAGLQYHVALAVAHGERPEAAVATMQALARHRRHGEAALWLLSEQFQPVRWKQWDGHQRRQYGDLLEIAATAMPDHRPVVGRYADYLLWTGKHARALPLLHRLAAEHPGRALQAAALYRQTNQPSHAEAVARLGLDQLRERAMDEPRNVDLQLAQTQFLVFLHRYDDATQMLAQAMRDDRTDDPRLRQAAAEVLVLWAGQPSQQGDAASQMARRLGLLSQAVKLSPNNRRVLDAVVQMVLRCAHEDDPEVAALRDLLVRGVAPELAHFVRGTSAMLRGDAEDAEVHLQLAAETMPSVPAVLNNLAVTLAAQRSPDLQQALSLADAAIDRAPDHPYFLETRGQIYLQMGRSESAIADLERGLAAPELAGPVHAALAQAYCDLGQADLAGEHHKKAARGPAAPEIPTSKSQ